MVTVLPRIVSVSALHAVIGGFGVAIVVFGFSRSLPLSLACLFVAGVCELPRGNTFGFTAFCAYGAFWWSFALFAEFFHAAVPAGFVG